MNRENLKIAADNLRQPLKTGFSMEVFDETGVTGDSEKIVCGSVGCAIGHTAFVIPKYKNETWLDYSLRVTGLTDNDYEGNSAWDWCFSEEWRYVDNTPQGAADRIDWLLEYGLPLNWQEQLFGEAPLCYKVKNA